MSDQFQDPFHSAVWDQTDAERLKGFLNTRTGKRLILRLRLDRPDLPPITQNPGVELTAQSAWRSSGYEEAISNIFDYTVTPVSEDEKKARNSSFPSLDDDAAWPKELQETRATLLRQLQEKEEKEKQQPANPAEEALDQQTQTTEGSI